MCWKSFSAEQAHGDQIMLEVPTRKGVCGVFTYEMQKTKVGR